MEEIIIDGRVETYGGLRHNFPTITVMKTGNSYFCYLNAQARKVFDTTQPILWFWQDGIVYALPSKAYNAYQPTCKRKGGGCGYTIPRRLLWDHKVDTGTYRLHPVKSGFGFITSKRLGGTRDEHREK